MVIVCDSECAITATDGGPDALLLKTVCRNTKHRKPYAMAQLAVVVLGLDVIMLPIMSHGFDLEECEDVGHAARLNKEADAGAELAARLPVPVCWDEDICWPQVLELIAVASAPMLVDDWRRGCLDKQRDQKLDRTDVTRKFDVASLNKSSCHLIWCDVAGATSRVAMQYEDALRVAAAGSRQAAPKALVVTQSEWRDALRASATVRIGVKTVWGGE